MLSRLSPLDELRKRAEVAIPPELLGLLFGVLLHNFNISNGTKPLKRTPNLHELREAGPRRQLRDSRGVLSEEGKEVRGVRIAN